ncbi:hypothetical protein KQI63_11350 [bacterium]|nr:hypothetical protein [bacterium]
MKRLVNSFEPTSDVDVSDVGYEDGTLVISTSAGNILVKCIDPDLHSVTINDYIAVLVSSPHAGQQEYCPIRTAPPLTNTLGMLFPLTSLDDGSEIFSSDHEEKYAVAALLSILENRFTANSITPKREEVLTDRTYYLSELFSEGTSIAILHNPTLASHHYDLKDVLINLLCHNITIPPDILPRQTHPTAPDKYKIKTISSELLDDKEVIYHMLIKYQNETDPYLKFVILYQIIELLLDKIYKHVISLLKDELINNQNILIVKEIIQNISRERWRLQILENKLVAGCNRDIMRDSKDKLNDFLVACGEEGYQDWNKSLYKARNLITHRLFENFNITGIDFSDTVEYLSKALLEVISNFSTRNYTTFEN